MTADQYGVVGMYPPSPASHIADQIRLDGVAPMGQQVWSPEHKLAPATPLAAGVAWPGVALQGADISSPSRPMYGAGYGVGSPPGMLASPPTFTMAPPSTSITTGQAARPLPTALNAVPTAGLAPVLPGIASRQEAPKTPALGLGLPGVASRQEAAVLRSEPVKDVKYITATATSPLPRGPGNLGFFPKWARSTSFSMSHSGLSFPGERDMLVSNSSYASSHAFIHSTETSFKWSPEKVCVPSWHRQLPDSYRDYSKINVIGEGQTGAVFIVQHKTTEKYYACKLLVKAGLQGKDVRNEIDSLRKLDHPNIVRLIETVEDGEAVFLLMELCQGGDLFGLIHEEGHLQETVARIFAKQMLEALAYCHSKGVVHRDVKPENFLLETEDPECLTLKLADFGIATSIRQPLDHETGSHVNGSVPYMAPEIHQRRWGSLVEESQGSIMALAAGDLWSCGIVIYVMLSGRLPYGDNPDSICNGGPPDFSAEVWSTVSDDAKDLIVNLLNRDPKERITAQEALRHQWFSILMQDVTVDAPKQVLKLLRRWRRQPKLRRIALSVIAKRIEADNSAVRLAQTLFRFAGNGEKLRSDQFVNALNRALCEGTSDFESASPVAEVVRRTGSMDSQGSDRSLTGYHVRQRVKSAIGPVIKTCKKQLSRVAEDQSSPLSFAPSPGDDSDASEEHGLVNITELKVLVDTLDASKDGVIDYTLMVAAFLPPDVYCEEARVKEAFEQFDLRKRGKIYPDDLHMVLRSGSSNKRTTSKEGGTDRYSKMVSEFDRNGDGALDLSEFRQMIRGGALVSDEGGDLTCTPMTEPTPSCTSRASPVGPALTQSPATSRQTPLSSRPAATPTPTPSGMLPPTASPPSKVLFPSPPPGGYRSY